MRYRKLDSDGDYSFGHGQLDLFRDEPAAVGQAVLTRLRLITGEWFLDVTEGTPYIPNILGMQTQKTYDPTLRERILGTQGVTQLAAYSSSRNGDTRKLSVSATIDTAYGQAQIQEAL